MEVNKEQAEKCRDLGAEAMRRGDYARATKMLEKSLRLFPLPGVEALLAQVKRQQENPASKPQQKQSSSSSSSQRNTQSSSSASSSTSTNTNGSANTSEHKQSNGAGTANNANTSATGTNGRAYTDEQVEIVQRILKAKEGGRGAHYRVLQVAQDCTEADIKKAYRKLSLKVHPDKNSAPHSDEAFKAVGLAYATLSDSQKRTIYDRYGDEDPDNRGAGGAGGMRTTHMRPGEEMTPEEIFNMFFGGGMPGAGGVHMRGPGGMHFYSSGFGGGPGGFPFGPGMPRRRRPAGRQQHQQDEQEQQQQQQPNIMALIFQFLPVILIMLLSFARMGDLETSYGRMPGENKYFSLTRQHPFINPVVTKMTAVKDIPYFVSDKFFKTYYRDRYQLSRVESMVEQAYENFLMNECKNQRTYKKRLEKEANKIKSITERERKQQQAQQIELTRCDELYDLFPRHRTSQQKQQRNQRYF